jgi:DUF4097 and DUF4098 domain-containing protein YvlB
MPIFKTPQPISVHVELGAGAIRLAASDRSDTAAEVRPTNPASEAEVAAAEQTGSVTIRTGAGNVSIERAAGRADISTGSGLLEVGRVDGLAAVRNSNGDTWIGDVVGELRVNAANGKVVVDRPKSAVFVKAANGDIVLGAVACGEVVAETGFGRVEIGVANGVPAWLELHTSYGTVRNELHAASTPEPSEEAVEIRARTGYGDITIHRSLETRAAAEQ